MPRGRNFKEENVANFGQMGLPFKRLKQSKIKN